MGLVSEVKAPKAVASLNGKLSTDQVCVAKQNIKC